MAGEASKTGAAVGAAFSPLGAAVGAGAGFLVDSFATQRTMAAEQQMYRQNQLQQFNLSQQSQRNAALNEVAGLKAAGLSPVNADGAAGMSVPSAPLQNKQAPSLDPQMALLLSQISLQDANATKANAEAKNINAQTNRMQSADENAKQNIKSFAGVMLSKLDEKKNPELYAVFEVMQKQADNATADTVKSTKEFLEMLDFGKSREARFAQYDYEQILYETMIEKGVPEDQAKSFALQNRKLGMEITKALADVIVAGSQVEVNEAKMSEMAAHIQQMLADAHLKYSKDYVEQFKQKDWKALLVNASVNMLGLAGDTASGAVKSKIAANAMAKLKSIKVGK